MSNQTLTPEAFLVLPERIAAETAERVYNDARALVFFQLENILQAVAEGGMTADRAMEKITAVVQHAQRARAAWYRANGTLVDTINAAKAVPA